jgi:hydroxymethylbilane synthase
VTSRQRQAAGHTVRIGSRGSRLALVQAEWVRDRVAGRHPDLAVEVEIINTKGDKILDAPLAKIGDKGLFTKELERALLDGRIDVAVHSAKDMPTAVMEGLAIVAFTEREDVRDVFVPDPALFEGRASYAGPLTLVDVPQSARVGSSSLRRRSQLLALRPDLDVVDIRGNVETRLRKLVDEQMAGTILAAAGLSRLGRSEVAGFAFTFDQMLPAVGQGALAIEARTDHPLLAELTAALDHRPTALAVRAERALLGTLEGGCQVPIAALAEWEASEGGEGTLVLAAYVGSLDGERSVRGDRMRPAGDPEELGTSLAADLLERGAGAILDEIRAP